MMQWIRDIMDNEAKETMRQLGYQGTVTDAYEIVSEYTKEVAKDQWNIAKTEKAIEMFRQAKALIEDTDVLVEHDKRTKDITLAITKQINDLTVYSSRLRSVMIMTQQTLDRLNAFILRAEEDEYEPEDLTLAIIGEGE